MNPAQAKRLQRVLRSAPYIIVSIAALSLILLLRLPDWTPPRVDLDAQAESDQPAREPRSAGDLSAIWRRDLRQALFDAAPVKNVPVEDPKLAIALVGTALESERSFGIFRLPNNRTVVRPVGAIVQGFEVVAVQRGLARLRDGSRVYELKVPWFDRIQRDEQD